MLANIEMLYLYKTMEATKLSMKKSVFAVASCLVKIKNFRIWIDYPSNPPNWIEIKIVQPNSA